MTRDPYRADTSGLIRVEKAEVLLERMVMVNVTVPVPEPVKTKAQLKAEAKEVRPPRASATQGLGSRLGL